MKCPNCKLDIGLLSEKSNHCPNCGYIFPIDIFEKIKSYIEIRKSIENLDELKVTFSHQLNSLQSQSINFGKMLVNDFEKIDLKNQTIELRDIRPKVDSEANNQTFIPNSLPNKIKKPPINWEILFGFNGFLILGVISVIFGVGFFIRKAFVSGLLGPVGKVSIIYIGAAASLGLGNFFRKKRFPEFGQGLIGMGIALLYYATYSGFQNYGLFNQFIAFFLMILITTFAVFIAVLEDNKWLAVLGLIGGFSTPIMLQSGVANNLTLYSYITILNSGLLAIAFYKKWNILNNLGFVATYLVFGFSFKYDDFWTSIIFVNLFFFIYSIVPFAYHLVKEKKENVTNTFLIFFNSFVALAFNYNLFYANRYPIQYLAIITLLYTVNFVIMASYLYQKGRKEEQTFIFTIAQAALILSITFPIIFSKELITVFWFAEATALMWISKSINSKKLVYGAYAVLFVALGKFFTIDYFYNFGLTDNFVILPNYTFNILSRYIISAFLLASFYGFIKLFKEIREVKDNHLIIAGSWSLWVASLFAITNVEVSSFFYTNFSEARFVALSILWAIFAISLMYTGLRLNQKAVRQVAIALFMITLSKVFFFDISELGVSYKFISFIVLGLILILTSYLYRKYKDDLLGHNESIIVNNPKNNLENNTVEERKNNEEV